MRKLLYLVPLLSLLTVPAVFSASPSSDFKYADERLGERKDVSDKFTFVRVILEPTYPGMYLGDRGEDWSHDYPEAGQHFSKILDRKSVV